MIRTLSKRFMKRLDSQNLILETGQDPAPTKVQLSFYCVCEPSTGEPLAAAFEVDPRTPAQEIEAHLLETLVRDNIL